MKLNVKFYSSTEILKVEYPGQYEQELWQIKDENKLELIPKLREEGNKFYATKDYTKALEKYELALMFIDQFQLRYLFHFIYLYIEQNTHPLDYTKLIIRRRLFVCN